MLSAPSLPSPLERSAPRQARTRRTAHDDIWDFAETCLAQTAAALHTTRAASTSEISQGIAVTRKSHASGTPADLLEVIGTIQGHTDEHLGRVILDLGNQVATTLSLYQPVIPFGAQLITPSAFYNSYDQIHKIARVLLAPVIYAENSDAIGAASINPVASSILAGEIRNAVFRRFGTKPFITVVRLAYDHWTTLSHKHFEL